MVSNQTDLHAGIITIADFNRELVEMVMAEAEILMVTTEIGAKITEMAIGVDLIHPTHKTY